jgi:hypothetical protein
MIELKINNPSGGPVTVNTGGGPAIVSQGVIYGGVQQVIGTVGAIGQAELADALRKLADAIHAEDKLGDERAELLEQVGFLAEQSTARPPIESSALSKELFACFEPASRMPPMSFKS